MTQLFLSRHYNYRFQVLSIDCATWSYSSMATTLVRNRLLRACLPIRSATSSAEPVSDPNKTSRSRLSSTMSKCQGVRRRTDPRAGSNCDSYSQPTSPTLFMLARSLASTVRFRTQIRCISALPVKNDLDPRHQQAAASRNILNTI